MAEDAGARGIDGKLGFDQPGQFPRHVGIHPVAARPGRLNGVHVEPGAQAEIVVVGLAGNLQAARAGVRDADGEPQLRVDALRVCLDDEILFRAGEAGQPVEHRHRLRFRVRRKKHAEAHEARGFTRLVAVDALDAPETFVSGNALDRHLRARSLRAAEGSVHHHRAYRFALVHQVEALVDVGELQLVRDQVVDVDLAIHVPVDDLRHVAPALGAAGRGAFPCTAGDELEAARLDLLARARDADDHRHAPALVAAFERLAHDIDVADAFEAVVGAALGQIYQVRDQLGAGFFRIDEMRDAEFLSERLARRIGIHADDHVGAGHARALHDVQPDAAQAEYHDVRARLDLGGVDHRADAGGHAAAELAHLVERRVLAVPPQPHF